MEGEVRRASFGSRATPALVARELDLRAMFLTSNEREEIHFVLKSSTKINPTASRAVLDLI